MRVPEDCRIRNAGSVFELDLAILKERTRITGGEEPITAIVVVEVVCEDVRFVVASTC